MNPSEAAALIDDFCEFINFKTVGSNDDRSKTRFIALGLKVGAIQMTPALPQPSSSRKKEHASPPASDDDQFNYLLSQHRLAVEFVEWVLDPENKTWLIKVTTECDFSNRDDYSFEVMRPGGTATAKAYDAGGAMLGKPKKEFEIPHCLINFLIALNGQPKDSLRLCRHCQKVFFSPSKRNKFFCTSRCQNTYNVTRSRMEQKKEG